MIVALVVVAFFCCLLLLLLFEGRAVHVIFDIFDTEYGLDAAGGTLGTLLCIISHMSTSFTGGVRSTFLHHRHHYFLLVYFDFSAIV